MDLTVNQWLVEFDSQMRSKEDLSGNRIVAVDEPWMLEVRVRFSLP